VKDKDVVSEFMFFGNRVSSFHLRTRQVKTKEQRERASVSFSFDYNVKDVQQTENNMLGIIEFIVEVKAMVKKRILYKIELIMEGAFGCRLNQLPDEKFLEMLEINGLITLSQISRAYILSVTSQSGFNPPVRMPMINVIRLREKKKQLIQEQEEKGVGT
jgi:preprotein translocase subunit SecB